MVGIYIFMPFIELIIYNLQDQPGWFGPGRKIFTPADAEIFSSAYRTRQRVKGIERRSNQKKTEQNCC